MTYTNAEIAEVHSQEITLEDSKGQPVPEKEQRQRSFWELLYIGGTEEDVAHSRAEFVPEGFQTKKVGQKKRRVPDWALDNRFFIHVFGEAAMKRARVAYLHWRVGMTPAQIADETNWPEKTIRNIITKLQAKTVKYSHRAGTVQVSLGGVQSAAAEQALLERTT